MEGILLNETSQTEKDKYCMISLLCEIFKTIPDSSVGKESDCNAGDPRLIPGSGRSAGEGIGYPLQYSWAFPVAQLGKESACNVEDLGSIPWSWKDPLEKGKATHFSILAWRIPWTVQSMRSQRFGHDWATFTFTINSWIEQKKKQTHRYREQASSYQWGQGRHSMRGEFIRDYIQSCLEIKDFHSITEKNKSHHRYLWDGQSWSVCLHLENALDPATRSTFTNGTWWSCRIILLTLAQM